MALHWNAPYMIENCEFKVIIKDKLDGEERWHPHTWHLLICTMNIGMPSITEKNYQLFADRMIEYERITGAVVSFLDRRYKSEWRKAPITEEIVRQHIGLSTNANDFGHAKFVKRKAAWRKQNQQAAERAAKKAKEATS